MRLSPLSPAQESLAPRDAARLSPVRDPETEPRFSPADEARIAAVVARMKEATDKRLRIARRGLATGKWPPKLEGNDLAVMMNDLARAGEGDALFAAAARYKLICNKDWLASALRLGHEKLAQDIFDKLVEEGDAPGTPMPDTRWALIAGIAARHGRLDLVSPMLGRAPNAGLVDSHVVENAVRYGQFDMLLPYWRIRLNTMPLTPRNARVHVSQKLLERMIGQLAGLDMGGIVTDPSWRLDAFRDVIRGMRAAGFGEAVQAEARNAMDSDLFVATPSLIQRAFAGLVLEEMPDLRQMDGLDFKAAERALDLARRWEAQEGALLRGLREHHAPEGVSAESYAAMRKYFSIDAIELTTCVHTAARLFGSEARARRARERWPQLFDKAYFMGLSADIAAEEDMPPSHWRRIGVEIIARGPAPYRQLCARLRKHRPAALRKEAACG